MKYQIPKMIFPIVAFVMLTQPDLFPCTNLLVTKGASTDGSVMITYTCDGEFHPHLEYTPAAEHKPDDSIEIINWRDDKLRGKVAEVPRTYAAIGLMNEHQLAISETTFDGREELHHPEGLLEYWDMMFLALQRAKTAREAIKVMTDLVDEYGYNSTGESFSIADTKEAWIMEVIGADSGSGRAVWVAVRVPDGYISCHANKARIGEFPLNDPNNCLYHKDVINFAIKRGYYDPNSGRPFRFCDAYCPPTPKNQRYADARVWSIFRRAAPSLHLSADFHRAVDGAESYPLWIKPDKKISLPDVFSLMRDHYEGTDYDMTKGIDAGPYGSPLRCRPMNWTVDSIDYAWERPISTQQTAFSFVSQSRDWLPDQIGGIYWYGVDDTYSTCYFPLYCSISSIPKSYTVGKLNDFSWESAWWVFNFVANFANLKYSYMIQDIQTVQKELEENFLNMQPIIEKTAIELLKTDAKLATQYLTDYSVSHAENVTARWRELGELLIAKYNDGYVQDSTGRPKEKGYSEEWLREVLKSRPAQFHLPSRTKGETGTRLID
jgi:dipeptidase